MRKGTQVICIDDKFDAKLVSLIPNRPVKDEVYTVRETLLTRNGKAIQLEEIHNPKLYDGTTTISGENLPILCPLLQSSQNYLLGEFIFEKGTSLVEPGITPHNQIKLQFETLKEMYDTAGLSRIYGGIHTYNTHKVSQLLGKYIVRKFKRKLMKKFKFTPLF